MMCLYGNAKPPYHDKSVLQIILSRDAISFVFVIQVCL